MSKPLGSLGLLLGAIAGSPIAGSLFQLGARIAGSLCPRRTNGCACEASALAQRPGSSLRPDGGSLLAGHGREIGR